MSDLSPWDPIVNGVSLRQETARLAKQDGAVMVGALKGILADLELTNG
jgi:hypothetical protein